jgi:hypothetical protein
MLILKKYIIYLLTQIEIQKIIWIFIMNKIL